MLKLTKAIFLTVSITLISLTLTASIPQIDVYVESLCPDCQDFIGGSFANYLQNPDFKSIANVTIYPYGNAKEVKNGDHYEFTCQHGPNECYGNVVETCALNRFNHEDGLKFMVCMENAIRTFDKYINKALVNCVTDQALVKSILDCAQGNEGNLLEHIMAEATPADHKYVPWIKLNGEHDKNIEDAILANMNEFLCALEINKDVAGCDKSKIENKHFVERVYLNFNSLTQKCPNTLLTGDLKFLEN